MGHSSELDEFLSRAVDRQIAEQRALREALNDLRTAVQSIATQPAEAAPPVVVDLSAVEQRLEKLRADVAALRIDVSRPAPAPVVELPPPAEVDLEPIRDELATVNANIDGIAQALIDLNAGLRDWATGVDEGLTSLVRSINGVKAIADEARRAATAANESLALEVQPRPDDDLDEIVDERLEQVEERIEETGRLAMNIRDRIDEFERVTTAMRQLPKAIEGTVAQAVRRAMAARAKLDREAEAAMDETLGAVDDQLDALHTAISKLSGSDDQVRKIELGQIELGSRLDSLQDNFMERFEALARAIDRLSVGREARAVETVAKPAPRARAAKPQPARKPAVRRRAAPKPEDGEH